MDKEKRESYTVRPIPKMRRFAVDAGRLGRRRHTMHGLIELDVTHARQSIRDHRTRTGEQLSFTAFISTCLARAVEMHPEVQAYRNWRGQLVIFDDVNVNTMVEVDAEGGRAAMPYVIRAANRKTLRQIHDEIRAAQRSPAATQGLRFMTWFLALPWFVRRLFYGVAMGFPQLLRPYMSSVLVTAVGMFGPGAAWWGVPVANFPLMVTLGGIVDRPAVVDGRLEAREMLCITLSFDHDIIDGAPAARFAQQFRALVEAAHGLAE